MSSPDHMHSISPDDTVRHLYVVPNLEGQPDQTAGINERFENSLQALDTYVPENPTEAALVMSRLAEVNNHIQGVVDKGATINGEAIDPEVAETFDEITKQGTDYWRLSEEERAEMTAAVSAQTPEELAKVSPKLESMLRNQKPTVGPITQEEFQDYQITLGKRLSLDQELAAISADTPSPAPKPPRASTRRAGIADLVNLDANGRAHYDSGVRLAQDAAGNYLSGNKVEALGKLGGKFMSKHELDMIEAHADLIRDNLPERKAQYDAHKAGAAAVTAELAAPEEPVPVLVESATDESPTGLRERYKLLRAKASVMLRNLVEDVKDLRRPAEFYREKETRRRRIIATVVGAGALIGAGVAIYLEAKGGGVSHHATTASHQPHGGAAGPATHQPIAQSYPPKNSVTGPSAHGPIAQHYHPSLKPAEHLAHYNPATGAGTVDYATAEHLHRLGLHFNEAQHEALTRKVLAYNHITDPRHLQPGYSVNFPGRKVLAAWLKESAD